MKNTLVRADVLFLGMSAERGFVLKHLAAMVASWTALVDKMQVRLSGPDCDEFLDILSDFLPAVPVQPTVEGGVP